MLSANRWFARNAFGYKLSVKEIILFLQKFMDEVSKKMTLEKLLDILAYR